MTVTAAMAAVFLSGYYLGYQKAGSGAGVDLDRTIVLALPKPAHADASAFEPLIPREPAPGADIDVDSPEAVPDIYEHAAGAAVPGDTEQAQVAAVITETTDAIETPAGTASRVHEPRDRQYQHVLYASLGTAAGDPELEHPVTVFEPAADQPVYAEPAQDSDDGVASGDQAGIMDTASAANARYTVQVGVFANESNALRRKAELDSQQLTAYINAYRNKRDQPRFNVRFGYFKDKSSAHLALTQFEQDLSGSGYVTRIRRN